MTEAEILAQLAVHGDRLWSILQYWTSVSFGMLIAGHFAADRMHWLALVLFCTLYILFSRNCLSMIVFDASVIRAGLDQLQSMADAGEPLGHIAQNFIDNAPLNNSSQGKYWATRAMAGGMFLSTLAYPAYCHFKSRN